MILPAKSDQSRAKYPYTQHKDAGALAELDDVRFMAAPISWYPTVHISEWGSIHRAAAANYTICNCSQSVMLVHRRDTEPNPPSGK
jgi:hypothetical protein